MIRTVRGRPTVMLDSEFRAVVVDNENREISESITGRVWVGGWESNANALISFVPDETIDLVRTDFTLNRSSLQPRVVVKVGDEEYFTAWRHPSWCDKGSVITMTWGLEWMR